MSDKAWRDLPRPWVADIGCGSDPFPLANILVDKFPGLTGHRTGALQTEGKLFIEADAAKLPFDDKELDFLWCSHLLEHTERPDLVLAEFERVSAKGSVWVPTVFAEAISHMVYPGKTSGHRWMCVHDRVSQLLFFPYVDNDETCVRKQLTELGAWQECAVLGYGTEMRIAWGWGSWPKTNSNKVKIVTEVPACQV